MQVSDGELNVLQRFVRDKLKHAPDVDELVPADLSRSAFLDTLRTGILLSRLIAVLYPDSIQVSNIITDFNKSRRLFQIVENINCFLAAAKKVGIDTSTIGPMDVVNLTDFLAADILWKLIRQSIITSVRELYSGQMLLDTLRADKVEQFLLAWANRKLDRTGECPATNLGKDFTCAKFSHILRKINPDLPNISSATPQRAAEAIILHAGVVFPYVFHTTDELIGANERLNMLFMFQLFEAIERTGPRTAEPSGSDPLIARISELELNLEQAAIERSTLRSEKESLLRQITVDRKPHCEEAARPAVSAAAPETSEKVQSELEKLRSEKHNMKQLIEQLHRERIRTEQHLMRLKVLYASFQSEEELAMAIYKSLSCEVISSMSSMTGYLIKKARHSRSFKNRFVVLRENFLFYFKSGSKTEKACGVVRIDESTVEMVANDQYPEMKAQCLLLISSPGPRPLKFCLGGDFGELEKWLRAIDLNISWWSTVSELHELFGSS